MNKLHFTFTDDEIYQLTYLIDKIKHKKNNNIYFFRDYRRDYHIFHHTVDNSETHQGFEESLFVILKELRIPFYLIIKYNNEQGIKIDKVDTKTSLYFTNISHNLGDLHY